MDYSQKHGGIDDRINAPDNSERIKRIILLGILAALSLFLFINRAYLQERIEYKFFTGKDARTESISLLGNHGIEQSFVAESSSMGSFGIQFINEEKATASGVVEIDLVDYNGDIVSSTSLDAQDIKENAITRFILGGDSGVMNINHTVDNSNKSIRLTKIFLTKGKTYTFKITAKDIKSEGAFDVVVTDIDKSKTSVIKNVSIDGKEMEGECLYMYTKNDIYSHKVVAAFIIAILLTLIFVLFPFKKLDEQVSKIIKREDFVLSKWMSRLMFFLSPMVAYFIVQKYVDYDLAKFIRHISADSAKAPLNLLIIGFVMIAIYTICASTRYSAMLTVLLFSIFGFLNYGLIMARGTPLVFTDLGQWQTAMQVADAYVITLTKRLLWAVLLTTIWCVACIAPPKYKGLSGKKRIIPLAVLAVCGGTLYYSIFESSIIEDHYFKVSGFKPKETYYRNGCALSFMVTWRNTVVKAPDGYDVKNIESLATKYPSDKAQKTSGVSAKTPNIIVIMNESFTDVGQLGDFETNEDYMPFFRSLEGNTVKGWMYASSFGGGTANSEFECLTGFTLRFLPFQSIAYRSIVKNETPSLTYWMKEMGYGGNIAFHPGAVDSYNRNNIYPRLGFDRHIALEDMKDPEMLRDFVSDKCDYELVEKEFEEFRRSNSDTPFYMFNVTIQNHGGYGYPNGIVDHGIEITSQDYNYENVTQFLNLMKYSDEAFEGLIRYFENVDEDTVILIFGDHQPKLDDELYPALKKQHKGISGIEWTEMQRRVPFMIWANYDIQKGNKEKKNAKGEEELVLSANYLSAFLKKTTGMPMTGFDKYLLELHKTLPVINSLGYEDTEGNVYDPSETDKFDDLINEYEQIQYNGLIDNKNRVNAFFNLKE